MRRLTASLASSKGSTFATAPYSALNSGRPEPFYRGSSVTSLGSYRKEGAATLGVGPIGASATGSVRALSSADLAGASYLGVPTLGRSRRLRSSYATNRSASARRRSLRLAALAASKAGVVAFADSLRLELRGSGATVGQLYFGAVDTEHFRTSMAHPLMERAQRRIPKTFVQPASVEDAAAAIQRAIERRSRRAVFPRSNALLVWAPQIMQRMVERRISN